MEWHIKSPYYISFMAMILRYGTISINPMRKNVFALSQSRVDAKILLLFFFGTKGRVITHHSSTICANNSFSSSNFAFQYSDVAFYGFHFEIRTRKITPNAFRIPELQRKK